MTETHGFSSCFSYPCPFFGQSHSGFRQAACCADCPLLMTGIVGLSQIWQMTIQTCWIVGTGKYHEDLITYQMPASKQLYTHIYIYIYIYVCVCIHRCKIISYHVVYIYIHIYIYMLPPPPVPTFSLCWQCGFHQMSALFWQLILKMNMPLMIS